MSLGLRWALLDDIYMGLVSQQVYVFWLVHLIHLHLRKLLICMILASLIAQLVKNLPAMQETWVQFLGWKDPLEKELATHSSILA